MFHRQYRLFSNLLLVADILAGLWALYLAYYLRHYLVRSAPLEISRFFNPELLPFADYLFYWLIFVPLWVVLLMWTQRYSQLMSLSSGLQTFRILQFTLSAGFLTGFLAYSFKLVISRPISCSLLCKLSSCRLRRRSH